MSTPLLSDKAATQKDGKPHSYSYFDRDLSWLSFNERVLMEAEKASAPLLERVSFLAIFSSNLDEFYRVRMPVIAAIHKLYKKDKVNNDQRGEYPHTAKAARKIITGQLERYGQALRIILDELAGHRLHVLYGESLPDSIRLQVSDYFFTQVLAFIQPVLLIKDPDFFPENNQLYMAIAGQPQDGDTNFPLLLLKLPTEHLPRFFTGTDNDIRYIVFIDDVIRQHAAAIAGFQPEGCYTFKVTRDADLHLDDTYETDLALRIEKQIGKRDFGLATRLLYEPTMPGPVLGRIADTLGLTEAVLVPGGRYHALKDLSSLPAQMQELNYEAWPANRLAVPEGGSLLQLIMQKDLLLHPPYDSYDTILRFFNEASIHPHVTHISLTMYRVASDSRILHALLSAAHNGKKVTVLVELKARFDEANNIKWAKQLKKAGVEVLYTREDLKVHAKIALVKFGGETMTCRYAGLLATGNLNESTARFYTDHILLTANEKILTELEMLFGIFSGNGSTKNPGFQHLLVAQFNLKERFLALIDREINNAASGLPARIVIKLNNLEERILINKLYEASNAGVDVQLIVRGICCLVPGVAGQSEHIQIRRIVDRYLEHGRIFIFENAGSPEVYLGSADWMNRNIYHRVEVCFPLNDERLKRQIIDMIALQWADDVAAVAITERDLNAPIAGEMMVRSQHEIYKLLSARSDQSSAC